VSTRRQFLAELALPAAALSALHAVPSACAVPRVAALPARAQDPLALAQDEDYWQQVRRAFTLDSSLVNLNHGGVSAAPRAVQEAMTRNLQISNLCSAYALWQVLEPQKEQVRARLARQWGVDAEELALTRNASESLQICQQGFDLERGDEVLTTNQDYPRMLTTFGQRERREGIRLVRFKLPVPCEDEDEIVRLFEQHITPRTRLILMSHVIFLTGQVLPVRRVVALARARGIPVIVDGAHAFAHLDYRLSDLDCDYYGVSLHKWLFAPHGTGLLYVRRERIRGLWPLMAAEPTQDEDIRKFEEIGTHPAANVLGIGDALSFHLELGPARKLARLLYLRDSWARRLARNPRVQLRTSLAPGKATGIATFAVDGLDSAKLHAWLWDEHRILTVNILHEDVSGLRVAPSVSTSMSEIERFCEAVEWAMQHGLPT
jgi:isopenicillin-N epimerase